MSYAFSANIMAPGHTKGRSGYQIKYIVIHHWDDPKKNPTFNGTVSWLASKQAGTSAHYVVEAGRVALMVSEADTAWHAGDWVINCESIGIECNPRASEADKRTIGELINDIQGRHGNRLKIIGHMDVYPTACPGRYYPPSVVLEPYISGANAVIDTIDDLSIDKLADAVISGKYGSGAERRTRLGQRYDAVQQRVNEKLAKAKLSSSAENPERKAPPKPVPAENSGKDSVVGTSPTGDLEELAAAVIQGKYGNGAERRARLGDRYQEVQNLVNRKLSS
ncbi:N-acetylmuramoyl-L-alanine amidase [Corynebacterium caspium]|uniref:N-acetylmuramoyl-L-alanine amidase n=1 Tax=Corynebacterium caspium TaxID=234828 RepID=UPI0003682FCC|nr:N-acetylmuramoyl-L-alanine amidase [Corynebacterium caspium]WKD58946.1 hypothetical protein CCASP_02710 [Corynebacterium caspium DSM 44850]